MESAKEFQSQQNTVLIEIENAKVSKLIQPEQSIENVSEGKLQVLFQEEQGQQVHFLRVGQFTYSIYKELPIYVTQYDDYRSFIFPIIEGFYVILIEDKYAENYDVLDAIFSNIATQIYQNQDGSQQQQEQEQVTKQQEVIEEQQQEKVKQVQESEKNAQKKEEKKCEDDEQEEEEEKEKEYKEDNTVGKVLFNAGKMISGGILSGAKMLSKGIAVTGNFIDDKIKDTKDVEIKDETFEKAERIKKQSNQVMKISAATAGQLISMNMKMAEYAGKQISNKIHKEEDKTNLKDNQKYDYIKEVGRQAMGATLEIIEALDQAATFIGASRQVIKKKYGEQAAKLADIGIDTAGSAGKTYKEIKGMGVKKMAKACAKETAKQTAKNL